MVPLVAIVDFLDSREKAIALWTLAILLFVIFKGGGVIASIGKVLHTLLHPKLLLLFGTGAAYCAGVVLLGKMAGTWHTSGIKETVYWFVGTGVVLLGDATHASPRDPEFAKKLFRRAVRFTLIADFLVALYVFPFGVELFLVPFILAFVGMQVVTTSDPKMTDTKRVIDEVLIAIGVALMIYVSVSAISDLDGLLTRENAETFLLAPALTLAFVPVLYLVAWLSKRELDNLRKRYPAFSPPS